MTLTSQSGNPASIIFCTSSGFIKITQLFNSPNDVNPADLAKATYDALVEEAAQKLVLKARDYHAGESFDAELSSKLEQFVIGGDVSDIKGLNLARKVVNAALRRLSIEKIDVG